MPIPGLLVAPSPPPAAPAVEQIDITWIAPDDTEWPLTIPVGVIRAQATNSLGAAVPIEVTTDPSPRGGVAVRHVQEVERYILLPVLVRGATHQEMIERWRAIGDAFTQTVQLGSGTLRVRRPDGSTRLIDASYLSGWEGIAEQGWDWDVAAALTLLAPRPWWRSSTPIAVLRSFSTSADYFDPYRSISSGSVLGETTIDNPGQVKAWPVWTVTGPLALLTATNHRTGEEFVLDPDWDAGGALTLGETVTITTEPVQIRGPLNEVWTGAIEGTLWGLDRGLSDVEFVATGAGTGTSVELAFHPLYQTA